ncbi:MAG: transcriptional regulator [Candidatus Limiplasma sp.]|nr:transcriptional regulator [Candidatus Limiplasma sp.]
MTILHEQHNSDYVQKAITAFHEIMSNNQRDMLDNINRGNKGELFVLQFLSMRGDGPVLPSELSTALQASTARISALLGALEKKGQIERDIDRSNRRNILVTITEAGRSRVDAEMQEMQQHMSRIFAEMGEADTVEFIRLMRIFFELGQKYMPCG